MPAAIVADFGSSTETPAPGEAGVDRSAHVPVPSRSVKIRLPSCTSRHRRVRDGDALGQGVEARLRQLLLNEHDVLVLQQHPEVGDVVPARRRRRAQGFTVRGSGRRRRSPANAAEQSADSMCTQASSTRGIVHLHTICPVHSVYSDGSEDILDIPAVEARSRSRTRPA